MFIKKRISKVFLVSAIFFFFIARAKAADFDEDDDEDIDTVSQMRQAYLEEQIKESKVTLFDIKTGEKLESAAAWYVLFLRRFESMDLVQFYY